ncbi:lysine--tRNA ligase [Candidatus Woesearchaeota archaeon]|nr:lysine--tRNA ligase [Candidatus Woesearchaeota archaeon]
MKREDDIDAKVEQARREIDVRAQKIETLRARGINPFPYNYQISHSLGDFRQEFNDRIKEPGTLEDRVSIAGRLMLKRAQGKISFGQLEDHSGRMQIMVENGTVGEDNYALFCEWIDRGDIVGVTGVPMRTKRGELSVKVEEVTLLTKAIRPLPEKWHGISDPELQYRDRSTYLATNPEARQLLVQRSQAITVMREHFNQLGFLEVEIPLLQPIYGGASARPFTSHVNALDMRVYLSISPELYLKRIVAGNFFQGVYTICKNFRNEGIDHTHNPEFTMMEVYKAFWDYNDMMRLTENVWAEIFDRVRGTTKVKYGTEGEGPGIVELDFTPPWRRARMLDLVHEYTGIDATQMDAKELHAKVREAYEMRKIDDRSHDGKLFKQSSWGEIVGELFSLYVEEHLIQPTIVIDHPLESTPLCKWHRSDSRLIERFEPFVYGVEIANAYSELNDPIVQRRLLEEQAAKGRAGDEEAHQMDEDFVRAIELGVPPMGGLGIGIDRLVMFLTGATSIRDVIFFPLLRPGYK